MDINNNQQVNTFLKGMNTDTSDSLLDNSQYRYAENVRLSTDTDNNSGELRLVDGTSWRTTFTDDIIYFSSIREYVIAITRNKQNNTWSVNVCIYKDIHESSDIEWHTIFGPCEEPLWNEDEEPAICGVTRWESDNNIKLYIADNTGKHGIIPIQIAKPWPEVAPVDFTVLSGYQQTSLCSPTVAISESGVGTLNPAKVQYAYRLYKTGGAATTLSPLSATVAIKKDKGGYSYTEKSDKAVDITIDMQRNPHLDHIQIFRITYVQNGQAPTVHKICDKTISNLSGDFKFVDYGSSIEQVGASEFLSYVSMELFPQIIESKGDTLFAANVKYTQDSIDKLFEDYDTRSFSTGNYWMLHNPGENESAEQPIEFEWPTAESMETGGILIDRSKTDGADLCHRQFSNSANEDYNEEWWHPFIPLMNGEGVPDKIGGKGTNIDWELDYNVISFEKDETTKEITGNVQGWGMFNSTGNYKGPRTYKHDETYRFGIILYDEKGRASSVKWICDVRIPPMKSGDIQIYEYAILMKLYYIKFTIKNKPENCSAYQIVQCPRTMGDRRVITQGIVGRPYREQEAKQASGPFEYTNNLCPTGLMTMQDIVADNIITDSGAKQYNIYPWVIGNGEHGLTIPFVNGEVRKTNGNSTTVRVSPNDHVEKMAASSRDVIQFASPEYVYQPDDIKDILNTYKSLIQIKHLVAYDTPALAMSSGFSEYTQGNLGDTFTAVVLHPEQQASYNGTDDFYTASKQGVNEGMSFLYRNGIYKHESNKYYTVLQSDFNTVAEVEAPNDGIAFGMNRQPNGNRIPHTNYLDKGMDEYTAFNYVTPSNINNSDTLIVNYPGIQTLAYPNVPEWNTFANGDNIRFADDVTAVGQYSYVNWSAPLLIDVDKAKTGHFGKMLQGDEFGPYDMIGSFQDHSIDAGKYFQPLGTGGKCILIKLNSNLLFGSQNTSQDLRDVCTNEYSMSDTPKFAPIHVANIIKPVIPYGGYNKYAIENSTYVGNGYFGTLDNFSEPVSVVVDNGDAFLGIFKYNAAHMWKDGTFLQGCTKMSTVYAVPVESDIDLTATYGDLFDGSVLKSYYMQDKPAAIEGYSQQKEAYMYNTAYNQVPNIITHSTIEYNDVSNFNWDTRIHNSEIKTNGETIDNWLVFKAMNFIDVDSRYGQITYMKLFKDRLMFWQDKAFGVVSSNERTALTDTNNNQIILGNGGILQRFDYVSTVYGMKPGQFVSTQSNHNLYFWDGREKEILAYGESLIPLTTIKSVRNYINKNDENDKPCMFYDNKNKEVVSSVVGDNALVYSEQIEQFTSIYTYNPIYHTEVFDEILSSTKNDVYTHNVDDGNVTLFGQSAYPLIQYVVNNQATMPKVFDIQTFGGRFYGGDNLSNIHFEYNTPLKQHSGCSGNAVTNREYDFRLNIPRNNNDVYGGRMRGKTMQCELRSSSNSDDFSLQYIITKYRMSWS